MATPFEQALKRFPGPDRGAILKRLGQWSRESSLGARIPANLRAERFLGVSSMVTLLAVVLKHVGSSRGPLESDYAQACYSHAREGGAVGLGTLPQLLGRAVDRAVWVNHLVDQHLDLFGDSKRLVREFVERLVSDPWFKIEPPESQALMSKFKRTAWATWNEDDGTADPFAFAKTKHADEVRACVGLLTNRKGRSPFLLLLTYERPAAEPLLRPTVADAATYELFRPPLPEQG